GASDHRPGPPRLGRGGERSPRLERERAVRRARRLGARCAARRAPRAVPGRSVAARHDRGYAVGRRAVPPGLTSLPRDLARGLDATVAGCADTTPAVSIAYAAQGGEIVTAGW